MDMENKRGSGIFLGVVAVATLIVAIIGATFAYFSITAQSDAGAVNLTAYEFNASLSVRQVWPATAETFKGLIPLNPTGAVTGYTTGDNGTNLLYAINEAEHRCVDTAGYQVCAVYELTFTNSGTSSMSLDGTLKTNANTKSVNWPEGEGSEFTDLRLRTATGNDAETDANLALTLTADETPIVVPVSSEEGSNTVALSPVTIPGDGQPHKHYVVVYMNENGDQSSQMGANYQGQLIYASATAGNQLTGTFTLTGGTPEEPENP